MATEPQLSEASGSSPSHTLFIDTNLDTHLAMIVSEGDTVQELKRKLMIEHSRCFPNLGQITVSALKVKCKAHYYHLSDGMPALSAFSGVKRTLFLHAEAVPEQVMPVGETERNKPCIDFPSVGLSNLEESLLPQVHGNVLVNQLVPFDGQCGTKNMVGESTKGLSQEGLDVIKENDKPSSSNASEKCLESEVPKMNDVQCKIYKSKKRAREPHSDDVVEDAKKSGLVMNKGDNAVSSALASPAKRKAMGKNISSGETPKPKDKLSQNRSKAENKSTSATIDDPMDKDSEDGSSLLGVVNGDKEGTLKLLDDLDTRSLGYAKEIVHGGSKGALGDNDKGLDMDSDVVTIKEANSSVAPTALAAVPNKEKSNLPFHDEGQGTLIPCSSLRGDDTAAEQANQSMPGETNESNVKRGKEPLEPTMTSEGAKEKRSKKHNSTSTKGPSLSSVEKPADLLGDSIMSIHKDNKLGNDNVSSSLIHEPEKENGVHVAAEEAYENMASEIDGCNVESRTEALELRMAYKGSKAKRTKKHQPNTAKGPSPSLVDEPVSSPGNVILAAQNDDVLGNGNTSKDLIHKAEKEDRVAPLQHGNHIGGEQADKTMAVETDGGISNVDGRKEAFEGTMTSKKTKTRRSKKHLTTSAKAPSPSFGEEPGDFPVDATRSTDMDGGIGNGNTGINLIHKTEEDSTGAQLQRGSCVATEETNENNIGGSNLSENKEPLEVTITTKETKTKRSKVHLTRIATCPSPSLVEEPENCRGDVIVSADKNNEHGNENNITDLIDIAVPLNKDSKVSATQADKKERKMSKKSKTGDAKSLIPSSVAEPDDVPIEVNLPRSMPDKDFDRVHPLNTDEEEAFSFQAEKTKISSVADGDNGNVGTIPSDEIERKDAHKRKKKSKKNKISDSKSHALSSGVQDADAVNPLRVNHINSYIAGHRASEANSENGLLPIETVKMIETADGGSGDGTNNLKKSMSKKRGLADKLLDINSESSDHRGTPDNKGSSQMITNDLHDDMGGSAVAGGEDKGDNDMDSNKVDFRNYFVAPKDHQPVASSAKEPLDEDSHLRKKGKETKAVKKSKQLNKHSDVAMHDKESSLDSSFAQKKEHLVGTFASRKPHGSLKTDKQSEFVVKPIGKSNARSTLTDQTLNQHAVHEVFLPIDSRRKNLDTSEALGSGHQPNLHSASGAKSKLSLKEHNAVSKTSNSNTENSEDRDKRKKAQREILPQANHHVGAVGKTSNKKGVTVANDSNKKESLLAAPKAIFKDSSDSEGSSEIDVEVNSYASTKTPDNSSSSDYSEGDNATDPDTSKTGTISYAAKRKEDGKHVKEPKRSFDPRSMTMDMVIRGSSSYKKAKLSASQLDDSEPVDFVPESQT